MSTIAQQDASRLNGAKSNGPVTEEGKTRSARNATKHGLTGGPVVLPHESQESYDELKRSLGKTYRAATPAEWNLIDEMAASRWRLNRIEIMETAILNQAFDRLMAEIDDADETDPDRVMAMAFADVAENSKGFRILDRHQRTLWSSYDRALQELRNLQEICPEQNEPELPADYSSLRLENPNHRGAAFMKEAMSYVKVQNAMIAGRSAKPNAA